MNIVSEYKKKQQIQTTLSNVATIAIWDAL